MATVLVVFARFPALGQVKTRLAAALGASLATELYAAFLDDIANRLRNSCDRRVLAYTPDVPEAAAFFQELAAGDFDLWPQPRGSLGIRLAHCFETHLRQSHGVVIIGSDAPTLPAELVREASTALADSDCVLGPAVDGGYFLIGLRRPCGELFSNVDWDGPNVLEQTVQRAQSAGLSLHLLPPWYDVDTLEDFHGLRGHLAAQRAAGIDPQVPRTERVLGADSCTSDDGSHSDSVDSTPQT